MTEKSSNGRKFTEPRPEEEFAELSIESCRWQHFQFQAAHGSVFGNFLETAKVNFLASASL